MWRTCLVSFAFARIYLEVSTAHDTCLNVRVNLFVQLHVRAGIQYLKIFKAVIKRIAVLMVNVFVRLKRPPKMLFHQPTMRADFFSVPPYQSGSCVRAKLGLHQESPFQ